jgi:hypothetical protein
MDVYVQRNVIPFVLMISTECYSVVRENRGKITEGVQKRLID